MSAVRSLDVVCFGERAGVLTEGERGLGFSYAQAWLDGGQPPLSQALPLDGSFAPRAVEAFFGGLLPEGQPRTTLSRQLGVSIDNDFSLLERIGGDTAGAVSLLPPGTAIRADEGDGIEWLDPEALATIVDDLPRRPMHADAHGEWRLSLAGAQDKLPVVVDERTGQVGLTRGRTPSTHILKPAIGHLPATVINEAFSMRFAARLGLTTAPVTPQRVHDREFLLVKRYDRERTDRGVLRRLHQEDFCQALGVPSTQKYEAEGGPGFASCFALVRTAAHTPARDLLQLLSSFTISFLLGNHDAHGKNFSLRYAPATARASLAPAYDLLSTFAYSRTHDLARKMAMAVGGEYRPDYVEVRHLERFLRDAGLGAAPSKRRIAALATAAPAAAAEVRVELAAESWDHPILDEIEQIIERRRARLLELTAPGGRAPGSRQPPAR